MGQVKERNYHFDNIKALLIFLVVLGHMLSQFDTAGATGLLYKIIFSFHMPAFIFVSGYFAKYNPKGVWAKLVPLYLFCQCIHIVFNYVVGCMDAGQLQPFHIQFFTPQWTLWYLFALIVYQLMIPIFDTPVKKRRIVYLIVAMLLGLAIGLNHGGNFMAISRVFHFLPLFLLGYYEKDGQLLLTFFKRKKQVLSRVITACAAVALLVWFALQYKQFNARWFFGTESYGDKGFTWYICLMTWGVALVWIIILLVWIPEKKLPLVETIGKNTLSVYILHGLAILVLKEIVLGEFIKGNFTVIIALSVVMTVCLSWNGFERFFRRIAIPYKK